MLQSGWPKCLIFVLSLLYCSDMMCGLPADLSFHTGKPKGKEQHVNMQSRSEFSLDAIACSPKASMVFKEI